MVHVVVIDSHWCCVPINVHMERREKDRIRMHAPSQPYLNIASSSSSTLLSRFLRSLRLTCPALHLTLNLMPLPYSFILVSSIHPDMLYSQLIVLLRLWLNPPHVCTLFLVPSLEISRYFHAFKIRVLYSVNLLSLSLLN